LYENEFDEEEGQKKSKLVGVFYTEIAAKQYVRGKTGENWNSAKYNMKTVSNYIGIPYQEKLQNKLQKIREARPIPKFESPLILNRLRTTRNFLREQSLIRQPYIAPTAPSSTTVVDY